MPFTVSAPTDIYAALQSMGDFYANTMGWTANYASQQLSVQIPGRTQVFTFSVVEGFGLSDSSYGELRWERIVCDVTGVDDPFSGTLDGLAPLSRLFLHGGASPEPWSLITFETAPGFFHHMYFGFVEKLGSYDGGAIVSGTNSETIYRSNYTDFNDWCDSATGSVQNRSPVFLFGGASSASSAQVESSGGIEIVSPEAPYTTYRFGPYAGAGAPYVGGGFTHAHNLLLAAAEFAGVDGSVNAHPVILHAQINADRWQTPVACIPGVRMININSLDPAQVISLGGEDYQVFPLCNKHIPFGTAYDPTLAPSPGRYTPGSSYPIRYAWGGATEFIGVAVRRE